MNKRNIFRMIATIIIGLMTSVTVKGQDQKVEALVPSPSVFDFTRGGGWGVALGTGVEYEAAYDGSDEYEVAVEPYPAGAIHWRSGNHQLFWEGFELGWRSRLADVYLVQAGVRYEGGLGPDDSKNGALDGIEERDSHIVGFLETRRSFSEDWRNWIAGRVMGGESGFGWLGVIAAGHRFGDQLDGSGTEVYIFSTFGTEDFINKDFGISAEDSRRSGLAATELDAGYRSSGINLIYRRYITEHIHVIAAAEAELYNSDIGDSPISRDDYEAGLELSVIWHF